MKCNICGAEAYFDGRAGDGPILLCLCSQGNWVNDGRGGYYDNPYGAVPIDSESRAIFEQPYPDVSPLGGSNKS